MPFTEHLSEPQSQLNQEQFIKHVLHLEAKDVNLKFIFDHIRNYGICGAVLWVGMKSLATAPNQSSWMDAFTTYLAGAFLLALPWVLYVLNFVHGFVAVTKLQRIGKTSSVVFMLVALLIFVSSGKLMFAAMKL